MAQVSKYQVSASVYKRIAEILLKTLAKIRTHEEAELFLNDLLTPTEKIMLAKRLSIAFLLEKGYDFRTIVSTLKVSSSTIASVNIKRKYGSKGYRLMIQKLMDEENVKKFLEDIGIALGKAFGHGSKSAGWYHLRRELEEKQKSKPF